MVLMAAAVSTSIIDKTAGVRQPLRSSEPDNGVAPSRRNSPDVFSRYLATFSSSTSSFSSASAKRCMSPLVSRTNLSTAAAVRRSQSLDIKRAPVAPQSSVSRAKGEVPAAQRMLFTSTKSLPVSFQGESFSLQVKKTKPAPSPRRGTPDRRKTPGRGTDQMENSKPSDHEHPWPRSRIPNSICKCVDFTEEKKRLSESGSKVVKAPCDGRQSKGKEKKKKNKGELLNPSILTDESSSEIIASDSESLASVTTASGTPQGMVVHARFLEETNSSSRCPKELGSLFSSNNGFRNMASAELILMPKKYGIAGPKATPKAIVSRRVEASPVRGPTRPGSPRKLSTTAVSNQLRGMSPSKGRNRVVGVLNKPSVLSFATDVRRADVGENRMADAHLLRLLHNTLLQWRFVNARGDAVLYAQTSNTEANLYAARATISRLHDSVGAKRTELQSLKQNLKLISVLESQITYLEEWAKMENDHSASLSGAVEALKASTIRLPIVGGAVANVQSLQNAICSAVDMLQAMAASVCLASSKVGEVSSMAIELVNVTAKERATLEHCTDLLSTIGAMQVKECSMRTHISQLQHL